jgi:tetratricopeptide (TPR) repeat protein
MKKLLLSFIILLSPLFLEAKKDNRVNYLNLGGILVKDGYYKRAGETLKKVNIEEEKFDFAKFYMLKGLINQRLGYPVISNIFLDEAIKKGQTSKSLYLYMARNYWNIQDYPNVIDAIKKAGEEAKKSETFFVILAESYKRLDDFDNAFLALDEGISLFPQNSKFYRQKFYYLMELGFYQHAIIYAKKFLEKQKYSTKDYLAVSLVLRENKQYTEAAALLEEAVVRVDKKGEDYPKLVELLGQVYIDNENYTSAALVLDKASIYKPKFAHKAATLYLKSKLPVRSFQLNRRVIKQEDKFKQRVGIDIHLEDYESLVATKPALKRYGILKDDNIRYALGYGYFRIGDFKNSKFHLKQVQSPSLFEKATLIFEKIEKCENNPLECSL